MAFPGLGKRGKQPPRTAGDETYRVTVVGDDRLHIEMVDASGRTTGSIIISQFNAWSLLGTLTFFLGIKLPAKLAAEIKL